VAAIFAATPDDVDRGGTVRLSSGVAAHVAATAPVTLALAFEGEIEMLKADHTVLVIVDMQVKLLRAIHDEERLLAECGRLIRGARVLDVPVIFTEQNPRGLGPTDPLLAGLLGGQPLVKMSFSCWRDEGFRAAMERLARPQVVLAGIESHVCVVQTAMELLEARREVHVVSDAVSSRTAENRQLGLIRAKGCGAVITGVEMALFELLGDAGGEKFKQLLAIVK
jgi:nicotinamidase-related amidase